MSHYSTTFQADENRFWPWCMIHISNRKDSAEACGGPTSMPGAPSLPERRNLLGVGLAALAETERPPPEDAA